MAYNVLKGNVQFINSDSGSIESMVDDHSNQTIAGIKTFSTAVTASGFFDSTNGAAIVSSPISSTSNAADERIAIFSGTSTMEGKAALTFSDSVLAVGANVSASLNVSGSGFYGSGVGLTSLPAASITGQVSAANISLGNGLTNVGGAVTVSGSDTSITIAANGISVNGAGSTSGLRVGGSGLRADPNRADGIAGGSLAGDDEFLVADNDQSNALKKATITNLQTYMDNTLSFAKIGGSDTQIFFNDGGSATIGADNTFTFNKTTNIMSVSGISASANISASFFYGDGTNITNVNATSINGNVPAGNINIGKGLFNDSNSLAVSASFGLTASANGLEVTASNTSGLDVGLALGGLVISPSRTTAKASPVVGDVILIGDSADSNKVKNATLTSVTTLIKNNGAGGANTQVQFNNSNAFAGDSAFTFNAATNTLAVQEVSSSGNISGSKFYGNGANLTGLPSAAISSYTNAADNRVLTSVNSNTVNGEANLTFDGTDLGVSDKIFHVGDTDTFIHFTTDDINIQAGGLNFVDITQDTVSEITFNEEGADIDFRVEGDSNTHLLYVNGGTNKVGIGGIPDHTLTVAGDISASVNVSASAFYGDGSNLQNVGGQSAYNSFTANFNVLKEYDLIGVVTTGSAITASLPTAATYDAGQRVTFKDVSGSCSGSNHIVISASSHHTGDRIDGAGVVKIQVGYGAITLASDGVRSYYIVSAT